MVLHSRGCGRVARRRFKRIGPPGRALGSREALFLCSLFGLPGGRRSGNPIFYIPPVFFYLPAESHAGSRKALFVYSPFLFPACVPHVDSRLRGWCHSGTGCRRMVSFWGPSGPFTGGRFPRRPWIPWSRTLRIAVPCLLSTEPVSFGYRCDVWWCLPGTGWCLFRCRLGLCRRLRRR